MLVTFLFVKFIVILQIMYHLGCNQALGMEAQTITDDQITASTIWNEYHAASQGRLNNYRSEEYVGAWVPAEGDQLS